jgi:hypothetical protein
MIPDVRFNRPILSAGEMTCKHIKSAPIIDIQLGRLTLTPELPRSGRMNLGRRFNAGAAIRQTLRHVGAA